ncbi:MAG: hypothetical protein J3K34DRAFT_426494 [Monoraphidium minutum]|nr:MAG: hypothetical protein J3K34DRAFT_426494 [Monoraphidium minutum]
MRGPNPPHPTRPARSILRQKGGEARQKGPGGLAQTGHGKRSEAAPLCIPHPAHARHPQPAIAEQSTLSDRGRREYDRDGAPLQGRRRSEQQCKQSVVARPPPGKTRVWDARKRFSGVRQKKRDGEASGGGGRAAGGVRYAAHVGGWCRVQLQNVQSEAAAAQRAAVKPRVCRRRAVACSAAPGLGAGCCRGGRFEALPTPSGCCHCALFGCRSAGKVYTEQCHNMPPEQPKHNTV